MKLLHVTIQTAKFEEELKFYQEVVGLPIQNDFREHGTDIVFLGEGEDTAVEIIRVPDAEPVNAPDVSIGFPTPDVEGKRQALLDAGYEVSPMISPNPHVKFFFTKDPAGMRVQFM